MLAIVLATYTAPGGARRVVVVAVAPGASPAPAGRPAAARLAAALTTGGGLVLDRGAAGRAPRVVAELAPGEGLAVAQAIVAEYVPRARRARAVIARRLEPADLAVPEPNAERAA
jgi:hypothetical protein